MNRGLGKFSRNTWIMLGACLLGALGYFGFHALFVKVSRSVERPFTGPARRNPYYVFERYLEQRGIKVRVARSWPQPLAPNTAVLWFSEAEVPLELRTWLAQGGALWTMRDPDRTVDGYAWRETPWSGEPPAPADETEQREDLEDSQETEESEDSEDPDERGDTEASEDAQASVLCPEGCLGAAQFQYGTGCLTLVRGLGLANEAVAHGETPARIDALLQCPRLPSEVVVVIELESPWFGRLLLERAPEALGAALLLLVLALWRAGTHFGPGSPARRRERRQMLEHVSAVGLLAARAGLTPLLEAARNQLRRQLLRRVPQAASLSGPQLVSEVAAATDIPEREVHRALLDEPHGGGQAMLAIARAMQALWRKT